MIMTLMGEEEDGGGEGGSFPKLPLSFSVFVADNKTSFIMYRKVIGLKSMA